MIQNKDFHLLSPRVSMQDVPVLQLCLTNCMFAYKLNIHLVIP